MEHDNYIQRQTASNYGAKNKTKLPSSGALQLDTQLLTKQNKARWMIIGEEKKKKRHTYYPSISQVHLVLYL